MGFLWFVGGFILGLVVYRYYGVAIEEMWDMITGGKQ